MNYCVLNVCKRNTNIISNYEIQKLLSFIFTMLGAELAEELFSGL
jgi:hypothetical protein